MTTRLAQYAQAAGAGLVAKLGSMSAGILTLWLLNRILEKSDFGAYSFTMSVLGLATLFAAGGLDRSVLYRLSRIENEGSGLAGGAQVVWVLRIVVFTGLATGTITALGGLVLASRSDLPGLGLWFVTLAAIAPLSGVGRVFAAWHQAQMRVPQSLMIPRLSEVSRAALLYAVWVVSPSPLGVALAVVASVAVPLVAWLILVPRDSYKPAHRLPKGDAAYGVKLMLTGLAERGIRNVDLIMIGILATGVLAADYALAARLVPLTTLGHELVGAVLTPRIARYIESADYRGLSIEYDLTRSLALAIALAIGVGFSAVGYQLVAIFGDFADAWPVLMILCAAFMVNVGFGASGRYLNMAGHAVWNLASTVLLLLAMCAFNLLLIPRYGATGAALGTLCSFTAINTLQAIVIWWKDRFATVHAETLSVLAAAITLLLAAAHDLLRPVPAAIGLALLSLLSARKGWSVARNVLRSRGRHADRGEVFPTEE